MFHVPGLDMDQPGMDGFFKAGKLAADQAALDDMAARVITGLIMVDAFDHPGECAAIGGPFSVHALF